MPKFRVYYSTSEASYTIEVERDTVEEAGQVPYALHPKQLINIKKIKTLRDDLDKQPKA